MTAERPGRRELAELVTDHLLGDEHRHVLAAVVHRDRVSDHLREDRRRTRPGADHSLLVRRVHRLDAAHQPLLDERALLARSAHLALFLPAAPAADDQLVRFLVLSPSTLAERRHAPRRHRVTPALRLALAATVWVVDGVHRRAAYGRPLPLPPAAPGLAAGHVLVIHVTDLPDRRATRDGNAAHLARRQTQHAVPLVLRDELDARTGAARELAALPRLQLDVVDERARRDVRERQRIARPDVGPGARLDGRADAQARGREDVRLRAVGVVQERDPGRSVGVVFDRGDLRRDAVLDALEVDHAVAALVPAALVAPGDPAVFVAPAGALQRLDQALLGLALRDVVEGGDGHEPAPRRGGFVLPKGH